MWLRRGAVYSHQRRNFEFSKQNKEGRFGVTDQDRSRKDFSHGEKRQLQSYQESARVARAQDM
jgi:hypothetical protein